MRPEIVLNLKHGEDAGDTCRRWLAVYHEIAEAHPDKAALCNRLSARAREACSLFVQRNTPALFSSHDQTFYEAQNTELAQEDAALDGDFPLGTEKDAVLAGAHLAIADLAALQCGFCRLETALQGAQLYAEAQKKMESGSWSQVRRLLARAADMGNADAQADLGLAAAYGTFGIDRNMDNALTLLRRAAAQNCGRACFAVCELYDSGAQIDATEAMALCQKAAALGEQRAAIRYADGFDLRPVREILLEQIEKGNRDAIWSMVRQCEAEGDREAATDWFNKAVEANQTDALLRAATLCLDKESGVYAPRMAEDCLRRAADQGNTPAIIALGNLALKDTSAAFWEVAMQLHTKNCPMKRPGWRIRKQHKKQMAWYQLAAEAGESETMHALCIAYHFGYPIKRDDTQAFQWVQRAVDAGNTAAMYQAAYLLENGFGTEKNIAQAIALYRSAAESGVCSAAIRLQQIYTEGLPGIPPDTEMAEHYHSLCKTEI